MMNERNVWHRRGGLSRLREALGRGEATIGFIGGSITDERPGHNWPEPVMSWLVERFPEVRFSVENAAIGATGSDLAVFRAGRDLIEPCCDLIFVEFAVNDYWTPRERRARAREGLIRKLASAERCDVALVYTFNQDMYAAMSAGETPESIADFEALAAHYGISSVWMGLYALEEVQRGRMRWEEWLPDGLHPRQRGSLSYANSVIAWLEAELGGDSVGGCSQPTGARLPAPMDDRHWASVHTVPFADVSWEGPWTIRRSTRLVWMDRLLETSAVGAKLRFSFRGRGLVLGVDFGKTSSELAYRIDGGERTTTSRSRPDWVGEAGGWYRLEVLAEDLEDAEHEAEFEVIHGDRPECTGTTCRIAFIGVLP